MITNSTISNNTYRGFRLDNNSNAIITDNTIQNNAERAFNIINSTPTIQNNVITDNGDYGIVIGSSTAIPITAPITNNSIYGHAVFDFYSYSTSGNASSLKVDAQNNWWGTTDTKVISARIRDYTEDTNAPSVNFSHYLRTNMAMSSKSKRKGRG